MDIRSTHSIRLGKRSLRAAERKIAFAPHRFNFVELMGYEPADVENLPDAEPYALLLESFISIPKDYMLTSLDALGCQRHHYSHEIYDELLDDTYIIQVSTFDKPFEDIQVDRRIFILITVKHGRYSYANHELECSFGQDGSVDKRLTRGRGEELLGRYLGYLRDFSTGACYNE